MLTPDVPKLELPISYADSILLTGSCFTEHISERLKRHKFRVLENPNGILFNPLSVAQSLNGYLDGRQYEVDELFYLNELWNSWDHHTRFSHVDKTAALVGINEAQQQAAAFVRSAGWVVITLGSAFQYFLKEGGKQVSNNHRAPAQWFEKRLLPIAEIVDALNATLQKLKDVNPVAQVLFTISPVRHIRDGVTDNNRSKARLVEAVHELCGRYGHVHYFPAYELIIDVLRDYRYYDVDFVHPNYMATSFVWEQFVQACIAPAEHEAMKQVGELMTAKNHRPRFPETEAHTKFLLAQLEKAKDIARRYPQIDMKEEIRYFGG